MFVIPMTRVSLYAQKFGEDENVFRRTLNCGVDGQYGECGS